jgi:hypothetical protein
MEVAIHGLKLVDPHPPQDLDGFELAQQPWRIGGIDRLQEVYSVSPDHFCVPLPLLWFGRQPRIFDPPSVPIEPLGRYQGA